MKKLLIATAVMLTAAAAMLMLQSPGSQDLPTVRWNADEEIPIATSDLVGSLEEAEAESDRSAVDEGGEPVRVEAALRGRVVDLGGVPIAGAEVCLQYREASSNRNGRRVQKHVQSGEDGTFAFVGSVYNRNLVINLQVTHKSHAPTMAERRAEQVEGSVDLGDIPMSGGGIVVGRVTDLSGNAIPGARVELDPENRNPLDDAHDRDEILADAESDGNGFFSLEHLMAGSYSVDVSARHRLQARKGRFTVEDARELDLGEIRLGPGYEIVGVVYAEDGTPVERARVEVESRARGRPDFDTRTDGEGRFAIDHVPPGGAELGVRATGFLEFKIEELDPANTQPLTIRLHEAMQISGQVVDAVTGQPVTRYAVRARRLGDLPEVRLETARERTESRVGSLSRSLEQLRNSAVRSTEEQAAELERAMAQLYARMEAEQRRLTALAQDAGHADIWPADAGRVRDHEGGRFELTDLAEGVYAVDVQAPDYQRFRSEQMELRRTDPFPELTLMLPRGLSITGRVVGQADGEPIERARVRLRIVTQDSRGRTHERNGTSTRTEADGSFSLAQLPPGITYAVNVTASGHLTETTEPFLLEASLEGLELELGATGSLEGRVIGLSEDLRRVNVVAVSLSDNRTKSGRTRNDGTYRLTDLAPGSYAVRAYERSLNSRILRALTFTPDVEVQAGETLRYDVPLSERPTGVLTGTVLDNARPGNRYRVRLQAEGAGNRRTSSSNTGEDGRFRFRDVVPGHYTLIVQSPSRRIELHREPVFVGESSEVDVAVHLASGGVRGSVIGGEDEQLGGQVWLLPGVTELPPDRASWRGTSMDLSRDRSFDFGRMQPGFFLLILEMPGRELVTQQVRITAGSDVELQVPVGEKR